MCSLYLPLAEATSTDPGSFLFALRNSGVPGLIIVGILILINLFSFTVLITKLWNLADAQSKNEKFLDRYRDSRSLLEVHQEGERHVGSPLWGVYRAGSTELIRALGSAEDGGLIPSSRRIAPSQMSGVQAAMDRAYGERVLNLESRMSVLASAVSGAPFLGLLGTVWGVMTTFGSIATRESGANLQDMAPGVSAALLTTVFALLVAIPAMFGYNYLVNRIRSLIAGMEIFRAEFSAAVERSYVDHGRRFQPVRPASAGEPLAGLGLQASAAANAAASAPTYPAPRAETHAPRSSAPVDLNPPPAAQLDRQADQQSRPRPFEAAFRRAEARPDSVSPPAAALATAEAAAAAAAAAQVTSSTAAPATDRSPFRPAAGNPAGHAAPEPSPIETPRPRRADLPQPADQPPRDLLPFPTAADREDSSPRPAVESRSTRDLPLRPAATAAALDERADEDLDDDDEDPAHEDLPAEDSSLDALPRRDGTQLRANTHRSHPQQPGSLRELLSSAARAFTGQRPDPPVSLPQPGLGDGRDARDTQKKEPTH